MTTSQTLHRAAAALAGAAAALLLVLSSQPAARVEPMPAQASLTVGRVGELEVGYSSPDFTRPMPLRRGGSPASWVFSLRNQSGAPLAVVLGVTSDSPALDDALRLRIQGTGPTRPEETLGSLESHGPELELSPGETRRIVVSARIPAGVPAGYEGREVGIAIAPAVASIGGNA